MRRFAISIRLLLLLLICLSGCGAQPAAQPAATTSPAAQPTGTPPPAATAAPTAPPTSVSATATGDAQTITDAAGRTVTIRGVPRQMISLAPSTTEILFALGLGASVLAVDDLSDFPEEAKSRPKVGGRGGNYNIEQIVALNPDLVFAAGITSPEVLNKLEEVGLTIVLLGTDQTTFESVFADILLAGQITGTTAQAQQVTDAMQEKAEAIKAKVGQATTSPRVYWELDATDPNKPFSVGAGNFVNDLIVLAGGTNIFADVNSPYPQVSSEQIVAADPEVIILSNAAYGITVESVMQRSGWQAITATKQQRVHPIDDNLISRPGPRLADGLEAAARLIHPELFE